MSWNLPPSTPMTWLTDRRGLAAEAVPGRRASASEPGVATAVAALQPHPKGCGEVVIAAGNQNRTHVTQFSGLVPDAYCK